MAPAAPDPDAYREEAAEHARAGGPAADARFAHLFSAEAVAGLRAQAEAAAGEEARRLRVLARVAVEGHLRLAAAAEAGVVAEELRDAAAELDGEPVPLAGIEERIAAEPDAARRDALHAARVRLLEAHVVPHLADARERWEEAARELGAGSPEDLLAGCAGLDLDALGRSGEALLEATDQVHARLLDRALREAVGRGAAEGGAADLSRLAAGPHLVEDLPAAGARPAALRTLELMGGDPARAPEVPEAAGDGLAPWAAVLRSLGADLLAAGASPRLPVEWRLLGDAAVPRAHALLWEGLLAEAAWLARVPGSADPAPAVRAAAAVRLMAARLAAARLAGASEEALTRAAGVPWPAAFVAAERLAGLGPADDLRAWALQAALRAHLRGGMGPRWFAERRAGALLAELWLEGGGLDPLALAAELGGGEPAEALALVADEAAEAWR